MHTAHGMYRAPCVAALLYYVRQWDGGEDEGIAQFVSSRIPFVLYLYFVV